MPYAVELSAPATAPVVGRVRCIVCEFVCMWAEDAADAVRLAVSEAVTNVVLHAYRDRRDGDPRPLHLRAEAHGDGRFVVEVRDEGCGIRASDPTAGNGFGLTVMRGVASEFSLISGADGTTVRLRFAALTPPP